MTNALIVDPSNPSAVSMAAVSAPVAGPGRVLVEVHHASLNYGDLNDARSGRVPAGAVLGSDVAGVVVQAAADGTGPAVGARVVALTSGAFAQLSAIDVGSLAEVPTRWIWLPPRRCRWRVSPRCVRCAREVSPRASAC